MGPGRLQATLANLDDPLLDEGAPNPDGRVAVSRGEDAPDAGAAPDTIAREGGAAGLRSAAHLAPGQRHGTEHLAQVAAAALAPTRADLAEPGFELVVVSHRRLRPSVAGLTNEEMRLAHAGTTATWRSPTFKGLHNHGAQ